MKSTMIGVQECGVALALLLIALPLLAAGGPQQSIELPTINVVLLDDQASGLPHDTELRRNNWRAWDIRLPTFLERLRLVAQFNRATDDEASVAASLYGVEISANLVPDRREGLVASELAHLQALTKRPSAVLARSSTGNDQLRIVFQDARDYTPEFAAKFLRVLAEISPPIALSRVAGSFGPFNPPPTIIFDPRTEALCETTSADGRAALRWGVLERTYLLPHYVLNLLATLNANVSIFGDTFYSTSVPEPGALAARTGSRTELFIAGAGINSATARGPTEVSQMALAHAGRDSIVATIYLHDWKARGFTSDNPKTAPEIRDYASVMTKQAVAQGKNIVFDVRPDLDPYLSGNTLLKDAADYMKDSPRWKSESQLYAHAVDSVFNGYKDVMPGGQTHGMFHSEGGYAYSLTKTTLDTVDLYKVRVGADMAKPKIEQVVRAGGEARIFTGRGDWPSLWNLATKSTAQQVARDTGATALHDLTWQGHGLPLERSRFEVYAGNTKALSFVSLDPTRLRDSGLGQWRQLDMGGVLFDRGNRYVLDLSGMVRRQGDRATAALDASGGVGGTFEEGEREKIVVGIPTGGSKKNAGVAGADLLLFDIDAQLNGKGVLPLAMARSWLSDAAPGYTFGGGWSFEPAILQGLETISDAPGARVRREVTVLPFETGNRLAYLPNSVRTEGDVEARPAENPAVAFVPKGGDFQPDLVANEDGTFSWVLRHGVMIDFDNTGLVKALRGPGDENIAFARSSTKMIAQRGTAGRTVTIDYAGNSPARATVGDSPVRYDHEGEHLKGVVGSPGVCSFDYDEGGHPSTVRRGLCTAQLRFDDRGRLIKVAGPGLDIRLEHVSGRGLLQVSGGHQETVQWHFGPRGRIAGVTRGDSGILWTRDSEGRIIQMAQGAIKTSDGSYEFEPDIVIGTLPCDR